MDEGDLEAVLAPIGGDAPTGSDLRQDYTAGSLYFRLRDARAEARDAERKAETPANADEAPQPQVGEASVLVLWRNVEGLALKALKEAAKDLEVASWLTESLVRIAGLRGLTLGTKVMTGLIDRYWDNLFPMPDEDGLETRLAPIAGLSGQGYDGTLMQPLRQLSLFERGDGSKFSVWQYQASMELAGIADPKRRAQRLDAGTLPFETVEKEAQAVPAGHWIAYRNSVNAAFGAWVALGTALDVKAGTFSPSVSRVHDMLQLLLDTCNRFAPRDDANSPPEEPLPEGAPAKSPAPGGAISGQVISGREQALRQVLEIAAWFRQNEPQSPLAYTLTEAVRRGRMTWPELIEELVSDEATRAGLMTSLGINPTSLKS